MKLSEHEGVWRALKVVTTNSIGKSEAETYESVVEELLNAYKFTGCNRLLKFIFFSNTSMCSNANLDAVSNEQGQRFQEVSSSTGAPERWLTVRERQ
jgi:hypothetical protein